MKWINCLYFSLFVSYIGAQTKLDSNFIDFLSQNKLQQEHLAYLNSAEKNDTTYYYIAKYAYQYNNDTLFWDAFENSKLLFLKDTIAAQTMSLSILKNHQKKYIEKWFENKFFDDLNIELKNIHVLITSPHKDSTLSIPEIFQTDYRYYTKIYKKKPFIAATLSLIPGLGELYIGNYGISLTKFSTLSIFGLQLLETLHKKEINSPINILNVGFFTAFYVVNIGGAYIDTKTKKEDLKNQLCIDVSNYYSSLYSILLH